MLVTTQWPLKSAAHLTSLVWVCVVWRPESLKGLSALCRKLFKPHWGRVTPICVNKMYNIGSDNGLSPVRRQTIIWTNAGILLIGPLGTNFSEILIEVHTFSFKKLHLQMSSAKWQPSCLGVSVLKWQYTFYVMVKKTLIKWFCTNETQLHCQCIGVTSLLR